MAWSSDSIRNLRRKMGWGYSDLARRLECSLQDLLAWESGAKAPPSDICDKLALFKIQQEECAQKKCDEAKADAVMKSMGLEQIHKSQLDET